MINNIQELKKWVEAEEEKAIHMSNTHAACLEWSASHICFGRAEAFSSIIEKLTFLLNTEKANSGQNDSANSGNAL